MSYLQESNQTGCVPGQHVYEYREVVPDGETSEYIIPPDQAGKLENWSVILIPSGTAKIQYTLSPRSRITNGNAVWKDWDAGNVIVTTDELFGPVQGLRVVSITGQAIIEALVV